MNYDLFVESTRKNGY